MQLSQFQQANRIALYLANDGELNPSMLIEHLWASRKHVYLPVLHPFSKGHLVFAHYLPDTLMRANKFGILEPSLTSQNICPLEQLDVICAPLVAFDKNGNRIGMGGGFYDRTLVPINRDNLPVDVLGLAHDCQQAEQIPMESWDIPLSHIVTPSKVF